MRKHLTSLNFFSPAATWSFYCV